MTETAHARINAVGLSAIHIGALATFVPGTFHWNVLALVAVLMYLTGGLGVTLCYHRTLTHKGLRLRKPLEYVLAILGMLALQGDPIRWVATHRKHHATSDTHARRDATCGACAICLGSIRRAFCNRYRYVARNNVHQLQRAHLIVDAHRNNTGGACIRGAQTSRH